MSDRKKSRNFFLFFSFFANPRLNRCCMLQSIGSQESTQYGAALIAEYISKQGGRTDFPPFCAARKELLRSASFGLGLSKKGMFQDTYFLFLWKKFIKKSYYNSIMYNTLRVHIFLRCPHILLRWFMSPRFNPLPAPESPALLLKNYFVSYEYKWDCRSFLFGNGGRRGYHLSSARGCKVKKKLGLPSHRELATKIVSVCAHIRRSSRWYTN